MVNSKLDNNGLESSWTALQSCNKQSPVAIKKTVMPLRDVQNENRSIFCRLVENSHSLEEKPYVDSIKMSGTKRIVPECPRSPPPSRPVFSNISRQFEFEPSKQATFPDNREKNINGYHPEQFWHKKLEMPLQQKTQTKGHDASSFPAFAPPQSASSVMPSSGSPLVTKPLGIPINQISSAKGSQQRAASGGPRALQFNEARETEYIQKLLQMSPAELSRLAVELEKQTIRLIWEEGREMERMQALNIKLLPTSQHISPKK